MEVQRAAARFDGVISCSLASESVTTMQSLTFVVKVTTPGNVLVHNNCFCQRG
jgi:hypothetical protein